VETRDERIYLRPSGAYDTVEAIRETRIRAGGRELRIGDIAGWRGASSSRRRASASGQDALGLGVSMAKGGDIIALGRDLAAIARIQAQLPVGMELSEVASQPDSVRRSIDEFVWSLAEAVIIVLVVCFFSRPAHRAGGGAVDPAGAGGDLLRHADVRRGPPQDLAGALILARPAGGRRDHRRRDDAGEDGAGLGALEGGRLCLHQHRRADAVGHPVTVAGFLPIATAQSSTGEYTRSIFQVNAIALLASWLAAVVVVPYLGYLLLLPDPRAPRHSGWLAKRFRASSASRSASAWASRTTRAARTSSAPFYNRFRALVDACVARRWW
jgi:multidrug efflux pump